MWEIINREKGRRGRINEGMEKWKDYFIGVLGGVEGRVIMGDGKEREKEKKGKGEGEKEISMSEIREALNRLREGKVMNLD